MAKEQHFKQGLFYSTNLDLAKDPFEHETKGTLEPSKQKLRVRLDNKKHAGKKVTLVEHFVGTNNDLENLAKFLKTKCGCGGSVKDGEILMQGEIVQKIKDVLLKEGYGVK